MTKRIFGSAVILCLFGAMTLAQKPEPPKTDQETASVRDFLKAYFEAFNKQDLKTVSSMWASNATYVDHETEERTEGREAIQADLAAVFKKRPETRLAGRADHIRLITPDVAQVSGQTSVVIPKEGPSVSSFSAILLRREGKWQFAAVEERPLADPANSSEALNTLEWLVGHWRDESDKVRVDTTFRWTDAGSFLVRSYVVRDADGIVNEGTQVIGWDPRRKQIRSWSFDSDGSFGEAIWTKSDNDWLVRSVRTLADGRAASGTYVMTRVDDNTMTVQLIGHEIEGEPIPTGKPVQVVRVPEPKEPAGGKPGENKPKEEKPAGR